MSLNGVPPSTGIAPKTVLVAAILVAAGAGLIGTAIGFELQSHGGRTTVVDDLGRKVAAPTNASRIVVLAPSIMDFVYRLGLRDRVVGVGCTVGIVGGMENEYSPNQTSLWGLDPSLCITDTPTLDTERVAFLDPGLVLASTITSAADVETLTTTYGLPVVVLAPTTLGGIVGDVALLAQLFPSAQGPATALEATLDSTLYNASVFESDLSANGSALPSVLVTYGFYGGEYYTFGEGTFGESLAELAGGSSISAGISIEYPGINASAVLAENPSAILYGTSDNDPYLVANETPAVWNTSAPYWNQLNGSKIPIDVTVLTEPGPSMILAVPWYEYYLHPTLAPRPGTPPP